MKRYLRRIVAAEDTAYEDSVWEDIEEIGQEFTSENTSINSKKLPAIFNMVSFEPGRSISTMAAESLIMLLSI